MIDESGQLSIDFMAGFTIFMLAFIMVMTMTSGLLMSIQSWTVDVDAVAYRTGVILMEDPGQCNQWAGAVKVAPDPFSWERLPDTYQSSNVLRMGFSLPKLYYDTPPNVILAGKTVKFFNSTWDASYYRSKLIFGDYPYRTNISIQYENGSIQYIGDPLPENVYYGSIRRIGLIKSPTSFDSDLTYPTPNQSQTTDDRIIVFNFRNLSNIAPAYQVYPLVENTTVNFIDFPSNITIDTYINDTRICYRGTCEGITDLSPGYVDIIVNGTHYDPYYPGVLPILLNRSPNATNILVLKPDLFDYIDPSPADVVTISVSFDPFNSTYLRGTDYYDFNTGRTIVINGTFVSIGPNDIFHQPELTPVWVEVRIW